MMANRVERGSMDGASSKTRSYRGMLKRADVNRHNAAEYVAEHPRRVAALLKHQDANRRRAHALARKTPRAERGR
jgi:hypothetical protein